MPIMPIGRKMPANDFIAKPGELLDYEQHGKLILCIALRESKLGWRILNSEGKEVELPSSRLFFYHGKSCNVMLSSKELADSIRSITDRVNSISLSIPLDELWDVVKDENKEFSVFDLAELTSQNKEAETVIDAIYPYFIINLIATRWALVRDQVYFKRKKFGFEPRTPEIVEDLKLRMSVERAKIENRQKLIYLVCEALSGKEVKFTDDIRLLKDLAIHGTKSQNFKEAASLFEDIFDLAQTKGYLDFIDTSFRNVWDRAFELLVQIGVFRREENLSLLRAGIKRDFSHEVENEATLLAEYDVLSDLSSGVLHYRKDLTSMFSVSIDSEDTKDIDDALSISSIDNGYEVVIHISDVASLVKQDCAMDIEAKARATSLYFSDDKIPMFPVLFSEMAASLWEGKPRLALSFFIQISHEGQILSRKIVPSIVNITKKLSYDVVDELLEISEKKDSLSLYNTESLKETEQLSSTLLKLWTVSSLLEQTRLSKGASFIFRREVLPIIDEHGHITLSEWREDTPARKLVSELMILVNETGAMFAIERNLPLVFRSQEAPENNSYQENHAIQMGQMGDNLGYRPIFKPSVVSSKSGFHASLGLNAYAQMTSPIRRYCDLINQRQILRTLVPKTLLSSRFGISSDSSTILTSQEIDQLIMQTENIIGEARSLQKERTRYWMFKYLIQENIRELQATVIKTDGPKPLAEIHLLGINLLFRSERHKRSSLKVGEHVCLSVDRVIPTDDYIVLTEKLR